MSFLKRIIEVKINLKEGFFSDGETTHVIKGHRVFASIAQPGGESSGALHCVVYGLSQDIMNRLTQIGVIQRQNIGNQIIVSAGNEDENGKQELSVVYTGSIQHAFADYSTQPTATLQIVATGGLQWALTPVAATSFEGQVGINDIMSRLAQEGGYALKNQGVTGQLTNVHLEGSTLDKVQAVARAGNFKYEIDDTNAHLIIMPLDGFVGGVVAHVSPETGMIGYPTFSMSGIIVKSIFNKDIRSNTKVKLRSSIPTANGEFTAYNVVHTLESMNNEGNGAWFTDFLAFRLGE